jgi:predicted RNase H-like nuclease (RuvC/YqgF family)
MLEASYKELCIRSAEVCKTNEEQKKIISQLQDEIEKYLTTISDLQEEMTLLNSKIKEQKKFVSMMTNGTGKLDEILIQQNSGRPKAVGFNYGKLNKKMKYNQSTMYTPLKETFSTRSSQLLQQSVQHLGVKEKFQPWICLLRSKPF